MKHHVSALRRRMLRTLAIITGVSIALTGTMSLITATEASAATILIGPRTVVSLTFDDADADQQTAATTMNQLGLHGTFYIPTGWVGMPGYLTLAQLHGLANSGQEIGGHTVTHPDMTLISSDEDLRQACNGRVTLADWGFPTTSFAYPFATVSATTEAAVKACGFNSARGLGDIQSRFGCSGCAVAETIPPADAYDTQALDEVDSTWTLTDLQNAVTAAEPEGGWVQFTFHHICDKTCDPLSVSPALFTQFATWLANRSLMNNTIVQTVGQVIGGTVKPVVAGPSVPAAAAGVNAVANPGLETNDSGALSTCWMTGSYGTNTPTYSAVTPGHTGTVAETLTMTNYADGDAKILPTLDLGQCAPTAVPGHTYSLRSWYKSTVPTQFDVYLRNSIGTWIYWTASPWFAAGSLYSQAVWQTPVIPTGYNGISFGLNLFQNGQLTTDDYALYDTVGAPAVVAAPLPPAAAAGVNGITNPGLEVAGSGETAQCWTSAPSGTNTSTVSSSSPGHTGSVAETIVVTAYTSGDAKILPTMDAGQCAPTVTPGHSYSLRSWYTSNVPTQFAVYLRTTAGTWVYWTSSPWLASSAAYTQGVWTTPVIPTGYNGISFGLNLFQIGHLTTDDYSLYDTVGAPAS